MAGLQQDGSPARAKHPKTVLAGPYGHPFHPVLVTLPIGAWFASVVFDIVALTGSDEESAFAKGAYWLIGIGIVGAHAACDASGRTIADPHPGVPDVVTGA